MRLNGILSHLNILVHIPLTELRWFYIQEKRNSFKKFISMFVASNLTPRAFEILLSVSSLQKRRFMSQARRTRYLARSAKWVRSMRRGGRKIKRLLPVHCSDSSLPTFTTLTWLSGWFNCWTRSFGTFVWHVSWNKITVTSRIHVHLTMLFEKPFGYFQMLQKQKENKRNV